MISKKQILNELNNYNWRKDINRFEFEPLNNKNKIVCLTIYFYDDYFTIETDKQGMRIYYEDFYNEFDGMFNDIEKRFGLKINKNIMLKRLINDLERVIKKLIKKEYKENQENQENKKIIALNKYIKQKNNDCSVKKDGFIIELKYKENSVAIYNVDTNDLHVFSLDCEYSKIILSNNIINLFYQYIVNHDLVNQKFTIQVFNNELGFLNYVPTTKTYLLSDKDEVDYQTHFTSKEIKKIKQNKDLHIDWNTAVIKEVK